MHFLQLPGGTEAAVHGPGFQTSCLTVSVTLFKAG